MPEELKSLIEKINEEAVLAASAKAREIEAEARRTGQKIIDDSRKEAESILEEAKERVAREEKASKDLLKQAGRDLILSLRKEIESMLSRIILSKVQDALNPNELVKIITSVVKEGKTKEGDIVITLSKEDAEKLGKGLLADLKEEVKKRIVLNASEDIRGGFTISYDSGRSHCDFTDKALADYISSYVRPKLASVLKTD